MKKGLMLFLGVYCASVVAAPLSPELAEAQIRDVVETFRVSIIEKDKDSFSSLFYSEDIPFIAVFSEEMLKRKRKEKPDYPHAVDFGKFRPPVAMISDTDDLEEKIWNVKVNTDGYLASVHFDYSDHVDGKKRAWGTESWSMIKVDKQWKITSVSFTVTEVESNE